MRYARNFYFGVVSILPNYVQLKLNLSCCGDHGRINVGGRKKLNQWRYSLEKPTPTEAVAARWQYMGLVVSKALIPQQPARANTN